MFYYDKKVIVKRYSSTLGEYNRPVNTLNDVGVYWCEVKEDGNSLSQILPQQVNFRDLTLYVEEDADIRVGDICYIYEVDEYDNIILSTEIQLKAGKPYKRRDHLQIPLTYEKEV